MNKFADCWENEAVSYMGNQEVTTTRMYVHLYVIRC